MHWVYFLMKATKLETFCDEITFIANQTITEMAFLLSFSKQLLAAKVGM